MLQRWILTSEEVRRIASACRETAEKAGWKVTIVIVDHAGHLLFCERLGARAATVDVALGKARTALYTRAPSAAFADRVRDNVNLLALGWMPLQGGLPLLYRDECVGAIGVSGVTAEQDEHVARAGCEALAALAK